LNEQENGDKKVRDIALKSSTKKNDDSDEDVTKINDNENLNLLVKNFVKFLKRRGNKGSQRRYNSKWNESTSIFNFTCYNCGNKDISKLNVKTLTRIKMHIEIRNTVTS